MSVFGGDDGVVNVGYFLPLLIGFHHLPKVHVNKPVDQQNNNFTRALRFLYISFPSSHDCDVLKKLHVLLRIFFVSWLFVSWLFLTVQLQKNPPTFVKLNEVEYVRWSLKQREFIFWVTLSQLPIKISL